ncbi:MAG: glycoside hydrolase family 25 protein [Bacteroidota bacterium]
MTTTKPQLRLIWRYVVLGLLLAGLVGYGLFRDRFEPWDSVAAAYDVHGIDVSHYQGKINWNKVEKAGVQFAFIKATEGKSIVDPRFARNWKQARKHNILRGAYHFYRPSVHSEEQARLFLSKVQVKPGDLPPVLDLEVTDGRSPAIIRKGVRNWMRIVEKETGVRPILYTMPRFADDYLGDALGEYPLWVASLRRRKPQVPRAWKHWTFWQFTHHGRVKGISGDVDRNYFPGTPEELRALRAK